MNDATINKMIAEQEGHNVVGVNECGSVTVMRQYDGCMPDYRGMDFCKNIQDAWSVMLKYNISVCDGFVMMGKTKYPTTKDGIMRTAMVMVLKSKGLIE